MNPDDADDNEPIPPLNDADRVLLESGAEREAHEHERSCGWCGGFRPYAMPLLMGHLQDVLIVALAHGHAVTIYPHPTDVNVAVVIHEQALLLE